MTEQAVRVFAAVVIAGVVLAIVLAATIDGPLSGRSWPSHDDYYALAVFAIVTGGMAAAVMRRPTVGLAVAWMIACWVATIGYFTFVDPIHAFERPYDAAMSMLGLLVMTGPLVAVCALRAASLPFDPSEPVLAHRLRSLFRVMLGIAIAISIIAFFPGQAEYGDAHDCLGMVFAAHGHSECTPSYTHLEHTRMAGGPFVFLVLLVVLSPIQIAYRTPRRRPIAAWLVWILLGSALLGMLALAILFSLALFSRIEILWPEHVVLLGIGVLVCMLLFILPLILAASRDDAVPRARVAS